MKYFLVVFFSVVIGFTALAQVQKDNRFVVTESVNSLLQKRYDCLQLHKTTQKYYHVQLYNGRQIGNARSIKNDFSASFPEISVSIEWESPEYKVWVGDFETKLAADQALLRIKQSYPNAFIVNPKK